MKTLPFGLILMGLPRKNINGFYELELVIILPHSSNFWRVSHLFTFLGRHSIIARSQDTDSVFLKKILISISNFSLHRKNVVEKKVILGEKVKTNLIDRADAKVCQTTFFKQIFFFNKKSWKICWLMFSTCLPLWWAFVKVKFFLWIKLVHHASLDSTG